MQSSREEPKNGWMAKNHAVGWVALTIYAFAWLINFDVSRAAESVFILCFVIAWFKEPDPALKWNKVFLLLMAFVALQVGVYFFAVDRFPDVADGQVKAARHMTKLFLCIAVAWWLRGSVNAAKYLLLVFIAGILVSLVLNSSVDAWRAGLSGSRVDFGYTNAQHIAFYFGLLLIMGAGWLFKCIGTGDAKYEWGAALALTVLGVAGGVVTQTRAVWLALGLIFLGLMVVGLLCLLKHRRSLPRSKLLLSCVVAVGVLALSVSTIAPVIEKRFLQEQEVMEALAAGKMVDVPFTSIGIRVHTWSYALDKIQERPLTGWGAKSRGALIDEGPFPDWLKVRFGHFHNSYLELLLAYGVLGLAAIAILTAMILKGTVALLATPHRHWGMGLLISWAFFFIINVFESYLIFNSGMYFFIVVGGVGMSFYLFGKNANTGTITR
ncbi:O-antigen ligase family protein [Halomonas sp. Mc5H-6]|uniref:O-antigen ligase family protein n=1 Tax=Halomonas sp. Mc5H-6 TaxID=2954500 RepID=UPI00209839D3|nr:O-antigen ligase family protein [Halomonas sp. Mc5H-6]MCO7246800.1 O-antigen ligase family protein [Halomonas sp. Mc5H-6]